jgi:hypothetical protein
MNKFHWVVVLLVLLSSIAIRCYWAVQKEGMHIDEVATFSISECDGAFYSPDVFFEENVKLTGKELKNMYFIHDTRLKGTLHDVRYMWYNIWVRDHTNFYYTLIRVFFTGSDTTDIKIIQLRGITFNILVYILSFFVFLKILLLYFKDRLLLSLATLTCFAFMTGDISNTIFIRTYELQMLMVLLLAYWLSVIIQKKDNGLWKYNCRNFFITALALTGVLWTGYFMFVLVAVFGLFLLWRLYRDGELVKGSVFFTGTTLCALALCRLLYLSYFNGFYNDERISEKFELSVWLTTFADSVSTWAVLMLRNTLYLPVLALLCLAALVSWKNRKSLPWVFMPALVYTFIVMLLSPYKTNRYMVAATPLLLLVIPVVSGWVKNRKLRLAFLISITSIYIVRAMFKSNIDNLFLFPESSKYLKVRDRNIHIIQKSRWLLMSLMPVMEDDIKYCLSNTLHCNEIKSGDIVLYGITKDEKPETIPVNYKEIVKSGYYTYYMVE